MRVLVACEESGRVRDAFRLRGHDAMSCDLQPTAAPGPHYQGDVFDVLHDGWDLMVAHPPCTFLANSGAKHLYVDGKKPNGPDAERWMDMSEAAEFFLRLWNSPIPKKALENPIQHGHAAEIIGVKPTQIIQPWMFGHPEQKATCLWLCGLPQLAHTHNVHDEMMRLPVNKRNRVHYMPPGPERQKERSRTYPGIAEAMAEQWGGWL